MSARAASGLLVSALIRRAQTEGGHAAVLAKGDATSGAILLVLAERGQTRRLLERVLGMDDIYRWSETGAQALADPHALGDYLARRRRNDPDLWVVELDLAGADALVAELAGNG